MVYHGYTVAMKRYIGPISNLAVSSIHLRVKYMHLKDDKWREIASNYKALISEIEARWKLNLAWKSTICKSDASCNTFIMGISFQPHGFRYTSQGAQDARQPLVPATLRLPHAWCLNDQHSVAKDQARLTDFGVFKTFLPGRSNFKGQMNHN